MKFLIVNSSIVAYALYVMRLWRVARKEAHGDTLPHADYSRGPFACACSPLFGVIFTSALAGMQADLGWLDVSAFVPTGGSEV